jgi:hypothetical protein
MPVATSSSDTCPTTCPLLTGGCYAKNGPLRLVWQGVDKVGVDFPAFLNLIRALPRRQLWRYGQAGDLPPKSEDIVALAEANRGRPVIAYTHRRDVGAIKTFKEVAKKGFHVNLSADSLVEADDLATTGLPVVLTLSSTYERRDDETLRDFRNRIGGKLRLKTPAGNQIAICPATYADTDCARCHACAKPRPGGTIIGFPAHAKSMAKDQGKGLNVSKIVEDCPPIGSVETRRLLLGTTWFAAWSLRVERDLAGRDEYSTSTLTTVAVWSAEESADMARLYKRAESPYWYAEVEVGGKPWRFSTQVPLGPRNHRRASEAAEAMRKAREAERQLANSVSLTNAVVMFFEHVHHLKASTQEQYHRMLIHVLRSLGDEPIQGVTP